MKKGIEAWADYDRTGSWVLKIAKKRGKLTTEDIRKAAQEYELGLYIIVVDAREDDAPFGFDDGKIYVKNNDGTETAYDDIVTLYEFDKWEMKQ